MCNAFSCIVKNNGDVLWGFGLDSHTDLMERFGIADIAIADTSLLQFAKLEITPDNGNYLKPDKWTLHIDEEIKPEWFTVEDEKAAFAAHKKWLHQLQKVLVVKEIINPFLIKPPKRITDQHLGLLKVWASVWDSVKDSVWDSVKDSVWDSVKDSVWDSVGSSVWVSVKDSVKDSVGSSVWVSVKDSVWVSVKDSVWVSVKDSVWAYIGSFFKLRRSAWKYTDGIQTDGYPFQSAVDLWEMGLVPSYDGSVWRLHSGKNAKVRWSGKLS